MEPLRRQPFLLAVLGAVFFALLFSTGMTLIGQPTPFALALVAGGVWAAVMAWAFRRQRAETGTYHSERRAASVVVQAPPNVALHRVEEALRRTGARRIRVDVAGRRVRARHRSPGSFGETIAVVAEPLPDGTTRLSVRSDGWPYTAIYDWGVNQRNVEAVLREVQRGG